MSTRTRRNNSQRTEKAIIEAARALFLESGYDGVNLEKIAEFAGVSRQTLYNRFKSKEAIFRAVVENHWIIFREGTPFPIADAPPPLVDPAATLRNFANTLVRFVEETDQISFTRLVVAESRRLPWIAEEFFRLGKGPLLASFIQCIQAMTKRGDLVCEQPDIAAHQFFGLLQEFIIWPYVMAIGPGLRDLPPTNLVIEEAIVMFLSRYGTGKHLSTTATPKLPGAPSPQSATRLRRSKSQ